jgi:hypothetical protein
MSTRPPLTWSFRSPHYPLLCFIGDEIIGAHSGTELDAKIAAIELPANLDIAMVDGSGEGWTLHVELMIVSPLTLKKSWQKLELIRLFNQSHTAARLGVRYPETSLSNKKLPRIVADLARLASGAAAD